MKTKVIFAAAFIIIIMLSAFMPVYAAKPPRFTDSENLLTAEQSESLTKRLDEISERYQFDIVVAVVYELDSREARLYAADYFEQNGYGYGADIDGAIWLLAVKDRDFGFAAFGSGIKTFTDKRQKELDDRILPYLRENKYYEAFMAYANAADEFLSGNENAETITFGEIIKGAFFTSTVCSLIIALIVTFLMRSKLKSVRREKYANKYIRENSMILTVQNDIFIHRHVNRQKRESSSSGGRGSSFRSSSGRSSSGHSGKY